MLTEDLRFVWVQDPADLGPIRDLFRNYQAELGIDLCFQGFGGEVEDPLAKYGPPKGALLLVWSGEETVACGAIWEQEPGVAELKRIYVVPACRGYGIGESVTRALISQARDLGYQRVRLDTLRRLSPALAMYEKIGFRETMPFNFNPEPDIVYYELALAPHPRPTT